MAAMVRKTIRVPKKILRDIEETSRHRNFSQVAIWGLRMWLRKHRRRRNSQIIVRAFTQTRAERLAEEAQLAEQGSRWGLEVLENHERADEKPTPG